MCVHPQTGYDTAINGYRELDDVVADIDVWATDLSVQGIFIDEASNRWLNDAHDSLDKIKSFFIQALADYTLA